MFDCVLPTPHRAQRDAHSRASCTLSLKNAGFAEDPGRSKKIVECPCLPQFFTRLHSAI